MAGSQATRHIHIEFKPFFAKQVPCRLLNCRTVASFKGQTLYFFKYQVSKKICLLKGCAISDPYLMLCFHCCSFPFILLPLPGGSPHLSHRHCQGSGAEGLVRVDPQVAPSWWGLCASFHLPCRIKCSIAGILHHGRSSLYWFVSNSTNKVFLVVIVPYCLDSSMVFDSETNEIGKNLVVGARVFQYADISGSPKQGYSSVLLLLSIWCVTAAFACGVPEILSLETPPLKWKKHNWILLRIRNE